MKTKEALTREQINTIPELIKTKTAKEIGKEFDRSERIIYLWIDKLRKSGVEVITKRGRRATLTTKQ